MIVFLWNFPLSNAAQRRRQRFSVKWLVPVLLLLSCLPARAAATDSIVKRTFVYAVKGTDTLRLDKYDTQEIAGNKPCLIFVFGGGFAAGRRDDAAFLPFYEKLVRNGYAVVAIDYRLGMKNLKERLHTKQRKLKLLYQVIGIFEQSIDMAVEDLFDATAYIVAHAADWRIDTAKIISCGSSAGAITVLQGEYELCNAGKLTAHLPQGFHYAGVISFAGAVFNKSGRLEWKSRPSPILLFHGDADMEVPYDKLTFRKFGFYGSACIAGQLRASGAAYYFYSVKNTGHEMSMRPMQYNWDEMHTFLTKFVFAKEQLMMDVVVKPLEKPEINKKMKLRDLIGNFNKL
jgi:predicted esterase